MRQKTLGSGACLDGLCLKEYRSRVDFIDAARGLSILIIIFAHIYNASVISLFVHLFHVPVFFFLAGLVWKRIDGRKLPGTLFYRFVVPYLCAGIVSIGIYTVFGRAFKGSETLPAWKSVCGLLYANSRTGYMEWNRPLWFIPCMVVVRLLWEAISRCQTGLFRWLWVCVLLAVGNLALREPFSGVCLPWETEVAVHMVLFFALGVFSGKTVGKLAGKYSAAAAALVCAACFGMCCYIFRVNGAGLSVQYNQYGNYWMFLWGGYSGTIMLIAAAVLLRGVRLLQWIGQNTLLILLWHKFPIMLFQITPLGRRFTAAPDCPSAYAAALAVICISVAFSFLMGKLVLAVKNRLCR